MIVIDRKAPLFGLKELNALEEKLDCQFPEDYRNFLLETNGGGPAESNAWIKMTAARWVMIEYFYSIKEPDNEFYDILQQMELFEGRIPAGFVPIAHDSYGNQIILGVKGSLSGQVLFWDHETEGFEKPMNVYHNTTKLSSSFARFANALGPLVG